MKPKIFAPGLVSLTERCEVAGFFTPDMNEFYFTETDGPWTWTRCLVTVCRNGQWSVPVVVPGTRLNDSLCRFTPDDSQHMYFFRPSPSTQNDIWVSTRSATGWGPAERLPEPINSDAAEWGFTRAKDGTLYISSTRSGNADIYRIRTIAGEYGPAERVSAVCTPYGENGPYVSPDHDYLLFHSQKPGGYGKGDLYVSLRQDDGTWAPPVNMGPMINTDIEQWDPKVSPDGKYMFYIHRSGWQTSNETSDIYWVDIRAVLPDPNGPIKNLSSGLRFGSIQCAVNFARSGDDIVIEPGVYDETVILNKDLVLQSVDSNDPYYIGGTIIQSDVNEPVLTLSDTTEACIIAGLTLRAGSVGIMGTATNSTIRDCRIVDNETHGLELSQISSPYLKHCLITGNGKAGIKMHSTTGGRMPLYCEPVIENCIIIDNGEAGIIGDKPMIIDSLIQDQ